MTTAPNILTVPKSGIMTLPKPDTHRIRTTKTLIRYPRFNELHALIQECLEITEEAGEPQCLCLSGRWGVGKSTLVETYAEAFPRYETEYGTKIPVFYMETPSPVTVKGMAAAMLEELGDPGAHSGPLWSMNSRLVNFIRDCEVRLVILDDFHHLIDCETNKILQKVSDWLKVLIKCTRVPFLVVGIDGQVDQILKANKQLSRLFIHKTLTPFIWDTREKKHIEEFAQFISYAEHILDMKLTDELSKPDILFRLHYATDGIINNIMNLFRKAVRLSTAENDGQRVVALKNLSDAYIERLLDHINKPNPFRTGKLELLELPVIVDPAPNPSKCEKNKGVSGNKRRSSVNETLTTK